ncbi:tetratricopeptide repeat protein [Micromonospora sp. KC606]|uniref:tetratricopeptide repeat protein n=1 Tax=Micromonospora sp. KC606 TaxID=2530379 RepID=UPI00104CAE1F|nr:tetratricopeptide repeat protein [Micromonospora sp. KC606]TDC76535.1 tetratricopeptide repeat protein [Micromonospora sp. KC606]
MNQTVFVAARDAFARILEVDAADIPLPPNLAGPEFDLVLSVHMAALVAVALRIRQRLDRRRPDEMAEDLATSLSNVANQFLAAGRVAEALPVAREALALRRELAREAPQTSMVEEDVDIAAPTGGMPPSCCPLLKAWTTVPLTPDAGVGVTGSRRRYSDGHDREADAWLAT